MLGFLDRVDLPVLDISIGTDGAVSFKEPYGGSVVFLCDEADLP